MWLLVVAGFGEFRMLRAYRSFVRLHCARELLTGNLGVFQVSWLRVSDLGCRVYCSLGRLGWQGWDLGLGGVGSNHPFKAYECASFRMVSQDYLGLRGF